MSQPNWLIVLVFSLACLGTLTTGVAHAGSSGANNFPGVASSDPHSISTILGPPGAPRILCAPSSTDPTTFRSVLAATTGGVVDYFNATTETPSLGLLESYDLVIVWINASCDDSTLYGNRLATYVDRGGRVILGAFCTYTSGNSLSGRIMNANYSPVVSSTGLNLGTSSGFGEGGRTCVHNCVLNYSATFRDDLQLQGLGEIDSRFEDFEIAVAYRPDQRVWYFNGLAEIGITGEWFEMVRNALNCGQAKRILIFDDSVESTLVLAARAVGYAVRVTSDAAEFESTLAAGGIDTVAIESSLTAVPEEVATATAQFVENGGKAVLSYWDLDGSTAGPVAESLRETFSVAVADSISRAFDVYPWIEDHPIYVNPNSVGTLIASGGSFSDNGDRLTPLPTARGVGGFTVNPVLGEAATVVAESGRTVVNGFLFDDMDLAERTELAQNQLRYLFSRSNVLILDNSTVHATAVRAAERQELSTTVARTEGELRIELNSGIEWDLVIVEAPSNAITDDTQSAIVDYVDDGGHVLLSYWGLDQSTLLPPAFGVATLTDIIEPLEFSAWVDTHPIFNTPNLVPSPIPLNGENPWFDSGDRMTSIPGANRLGGFTSSPTVGEVAIIQANGGRTLVNGFDYDSYDGCRILDFVENQIAFLISEPPAPGDTEFRRGDCNTDGGIDVADAAFLLNFLFVSGPGSSCADACDSNDDGTVDISDAAFKLNFLFVPGSPNPPLPGGSCGVDPTDDALGCADYSACP